MTYEQQKAAIKAAYEAPDSDVEGFLIVCAMVGALIIFAVAAFV